MGSKLILFPLSPARLMAPIIVSVPFAASRKALFFCATPRVAIFSAALTTDAAPPERAIWMREKPHSFRCVCDLVCEGGKVGHACFAWMQFVSRARTHADLAATVTRSAIQGLSKEESRELDVARRGLGSQRGAGRSAALSQIEYNMG